MTVPKKRKGNTTSQRHGKQTAMTVNPDFELGPQPLKAPSSSWWCDCDRDEFSKRVSAETERIQSSKFARTHIALLTS